jgi:hypothetical protein
MVTRRFPRPWTVEATSDGFLIKDGHGLPLSFVFGRASARIDHSELTAAEARRISELIARLPELMEKEWSTGSQNQRKRRQSPSNEVTLADLDNTGTMLEVGCENCHRQLFISSCSLKLPRRMSVAEVARHLICSQCGIKNTELKAPIWARTDTRVSDAPRATPILAKMVTNNGRSSVPKIEMEALLKACSLAFLILTIVIAVAPFVGAKKLVVDPTPSPISILPTNAAETPPPMASISSTTCPLSAVQSLIESKQIEAIKISSFESCMGLGVADRLWRKMDEKGRQGLIMALECAIAPGGKRLPCLKLYSQQTGVLFGSSEMGKLTIAR